MDVDPSTVRIRIQREGRMLREKMKNARAGSKILVQFGFELIKPEDYTSF